MKKLLFLLVFINGLTFSQMKPGIDYMPQIAFFDFVVNYLHNPNKTILPEDIEASYIEQNWYFDKLEALGLTNLVSDGQYHRTTLNHPDDNFFINDMGFAWKHEPPSTFLPSRYMNSLGHKEFEYVMELGGDAVETISEEDNFGFAKQNTQWDKSSYWVMKQETKPPGLQITGANGFDPIIFPQVKVRMARIASGHLRDKAIMWAQLPWTQFPIDDVIKIRILLRRGPAPLGGSCVFTLNATSIVGEPRPNYNVEPRRDFLHPQVEPNSPATLFVQEVTAANLGDVCLTSYVWYESNPIQIGKNSNFDFNIVWSGNADLFIDKIMVYNTRYEELYVDHTITTTQIFADMTDRYPPAETVEDDLFQSFYFDEPFQLSARFRGEIQDFISSEYGPHPVFELNSAVGGIPKHFLDFDRRYARIQPNTGKYKNYLLYDMYPIDKNTTTSTASLQKRFDLFINYNNVDDDDGTHHDPEKYKYVGMLPISLAAKEANIPFFSTICVAAEQYVKNTGTTLSLVDGDHRRRPPTPDEIKAMGNISLAYGAKGFMYYMVPSRADQPADGETVFSQYGLFEEENKAFNPSDPSTWVQSPAELQVPNERYDAVQEFITSTNLIASKLLQLNWQKARSWNLSYSGTPTWIENINTKIPGTSTFDEITYVEPGEFVENGQTAEDTDERYVYIVNRRCNLQENDNSARDISFNIAQFKSYVNYKITDLKSNNTYFKTYSQQISLNLSAGEGTLLKIEPVVHCGGILLENESVQYPVEVKGDIILSPGKRLGIMTGAEMTFLNSAKLNVSSGYLEIDAGQPGEVKLDFVARNWTAGNGIIAGGANVSINNAIISNASAGISAWNPSSLSISNTTIENCWFGVAVQSRPIGSIYLDNVKVINCDARGVTLDNAHLEIKNSRITGSDYGIRIVNGMVSAGDYNASYQHGLDTLSDNMVGLYSYDSDVYFGYYDEPDFRGTNNLFIENSFNIVAWEGSEISAQHNFWDDISDLRIEIDLKSNVYTSPELLEGSDNPLKEDEGELLSNNPKLSNGEGNTVKEKVGIIRQLIKAKNTKGARSICIDILENNSDDELVPLVLRLFKRTFNREEIDDYKAFLKHGNNTRKGTIAKGLLQVQKAIFEENPIVFLDSVASEYAKKLPAEQALYKKAVYQMMVQGDRKGAKISRLKLETDFPESQLLTDLNLLLTDTMIARNSTLNQGLGKSNSEGVVAVEYDYNLYNNYPNPFNPETVIKFSLKEKSNVTLTVYNIAGQKVAELVMGEMEKGMYEKRFNGTKFSSGVYIFRLNAQSLEGTTHYSKTMKSLLLK